MRYALFAVVLVSAALPLIAQEPTAVKDEAKLFKPETIKQANEAIAALAKNGIRLVIETYATVPPGMTEKVKELDAKAREEVFEEWARKRIKTLGANSIHIVLTNEPKHLQVTLGAEAHKKAPELRPTLVKGMLEKLKKMQVDEALLGAIATLHKQFDAPPKDNPKEPLDMPRVIHFEIHADDPERAIRFYSTVLGWHFTKWNGPMDYWLIKTGPHEQPGIDGGMIRRQGPIDGQQVIAFVCTVDVPNVDEYLAKATAHGGTLALPKMPIPNVGWLAYFKDTEGNIVGMMQPDADAR